MLRSEGIRQLHALSYVPQAHADKWRPRPISAILDNQIAAEAWRAPLRYPAGREAIEPPAEAEAAAHPPMRPRRLRQPDIYACVARSWSTGAEGITDHRDGIAS